LSLEQSRRTAPANASDEADTSEAVVEWRSKRDDLIAQVWSELRVLEPLEISDPHPFVSLLSTVKGKKLLPRVLRHLSNEQTLTAMTMIVASFDTLDVVKQSVLLDEEVVVHQSARVEKRNEAQRQSDAFAISIVPSMFTLMTTAPMQIVSGMLALFIERNDPIRVAQSKSGIAFLTIFLSRAETLRQQGVDGNGPNANELAQWSEIFNLLIQRLTYSPSHLTSLFPSTRAKTNLPFGTFIASKRKDQLEVEDQDVWQLMAALAVSANMNQQQLIVTGLREKILENVLEAKEWRMNNQSTPSEEGDLRIRNVNLLLHALNLDAAQITV
jgi:DNA topoisomerase 2-associated protein PAT1